MRATIRSEQGDDPKRWYHCYMFYNNDMWFSFAVWHVGCKKKVAITRAFHHAMKSFVRSLRFKPALAHGEPVEGVAALNLSKLQI